MKEQISLNGPGVPPDGQPSAGRVVDVQIDELILDGFGPLDSRPVGPRRPNSRRPDSGRPDSARPQVAHAAEAFRRELARELAAAGPAAEQLAETIADAVFRQLAAQPPRGGAR